MSKVNDFVIFVEADVTDVTLNKFSKECDVELSPVSQMPQLAQLRGAWENLGMVLEIFFDDPYLILEAKQHHMCH